MVQLLDLPNEMLVKIIRSLNPCDGLEEFTLCSKFVNQLGLSTLQKHRPLKKEYSFVVFDTPDDPDEQHITLLLCKFLEDDDIAQHVQSVTVGWCEEMDMNRDYAAMNSAIAIHKKKINSLVDTCRYISPEDKLIWKRDILDGCALTAAALAITLLPNLKKITIEPSWEQPPRILKVISNIAEAARQDPKGSHPLSLLECMSLDRDDLESAGPVALFKPFAGLPSIRSLSGKLIEGSPSGWDLRELIEGLPSKWNTDRCSQLQSLDFRRSDIDMQSLEVLISASTLQSFTYSYEDNHFGSRQANLQAVAWEPQKIVQSLLRHAKDSLVSLNLYFENQYEEESPFFDDFIGPLSGFSCLKDVSLEHSMFIEELDTEYPDYQRPEGQSCKMRSKPECERDRSYKLETGKVHRLVDMLPLSIEKVTLKGAYCYRTATGLLKDLTKSKKSALPELKEVNFDGGFKRGKTMFSMDTKLVFGLAGVSINERPEQAVAWYRRR